MQKIYPLIIFCLSMLVANAQTNVSGGIYSNTTWTKINSPYIVTDTVVVFPSVTLTIEPGVLVKFANNKRLEIRQAKLIAVGTSTDSITFTSNSSSPHPGSWGGIFLNIDSGTQFNYCNFCYAEHGVDLNNSGYIFFRNSLFSNNNIGCGSYESNCAYILIDSCSFSNNVQSGIDGLELSVVSNCYISHNTIGINTFAVSGTRNEFVNCTISDDSIGIYGIEASSVNNCIIKSNFYGIVASSGDNIIYNSRVDSNSVIGIMMSGADTVTNCQITNNSVGLRLLHHAVVNQNVIENNATGILETYSPNVIYCNRICNNSTCNLNYNVAFGSNSAYLNNYWCTNDSATVASTIYDGYDNISLGLVSFMPLDNSQCYLSTDIPSLHTAATAFSLSPNPATNSFTITTGEEIIGSTITVTDITGRKMLAVEQQTANQKLETTNLASGVYLIILTTPDGRSATKKLLISK